MLPASLILREFGNGSVRFDDLVLNTVPVRDLSCSFGVPVMSAKKDEDEQPRKERVIFLVTEKELKAIDEFANENYFGNRSMVIRQALIDFGLFKKASK